MNRFDRFAKSCLNRHASRIAINAVLFNNGGGGQGEEGEPKANGKTEANAKAKADGQSAVVSSTPNPNAKSISDISDIPEVKAYLDSIGAEVRSMVSAVVYENKGKYRADIAVIKFDKQTGEVTAPEGYGPTPEQAETITGCWSNYKFPTLKLVERLILPDALKGKKDEDIFVFRNLDNKIVMLQERATINDVNKRYVPWTYWSDDQWRCMEPEGKLPLWGLDQVKVNSTIFIHEGAKAARTVREMVEQKTPDAKKRFAAHPWALELGSAAHVGWIGGALAPHRTDWSPLRDAGIKLIYIVSDNDKPGVSAVQKISRNLYSKTLNVKFSDEWPRGFDLADDFPPEMFKGENNQRVYTGPLFKECIHPATWASDIKVVNNKKQITLRDAFKDMWAYCIETDMYLNIDFPSMQYPSTIFNKVTAPFCEHNMLSDHLDRLYAGKENAIAYRPDKPGIRIISNNKSKRVINLFEPTAIKPKPGNVQPFLDFIYFVFPVKSEAGEILRWFATLIGRPEIRMGFGLLLVSETQGIGKSFLGHNIIKPLVGPWNYSAVSSGIITNSTYNDWIANKRVIVCDEIYEGHSWKAYNILKDKITQDHFTVNSKYRRPYDVDNWANIIALSNQEDALRIETSDRRIYMPEIADIPWPKEKYDELAEWLNGDGLSIIYYWALNQSKDFYLPAHYKPLMTDRKKALAEQSLSEMQKSIIASLSAVADTQNAYINEMLKPQSDRDETLLAAVKKPAAYSAKDIQKHFKDKARGPFYDKEHHAGSALRAAGFFEYKKRLKVAGSNTLMYLCPLALNQLMGNDGLPIIVKQQTFALNDQDMDAPTQEAKLKQLNDAVRSLYVKDVELLFPL